MPVASELTADLFCNKIFNNLRAKVEESKHNNAMCNSSPLLYPGRQAGTLVISSLNVAADRSSRNVTSLNHLDLQKVLVDLNCVYISRLRHQLPVQKSGLTAALYSTNVINVW